MAAKHDNGKIHNSWRRLEKYTAARIGLGRVGCSQTTEHHLAFQLAHACARDAVVRPMVWEALAEAIEEWGIPHMHLKSRAATRDQYLKRPDLGRQLSTISVNSVNHWKQDVPTACDLVVVVADGLSSTGVELHTVSLLLALLGKSSGGAIMPDIICTVEQGRVAIGDDIAGRLGARFCVVIIGERPGLSSPDSLGMYFTYCADKNSTDANRNCISNIRPGGLSFTDAATRLKWLIGRAAQLQMSGVMLKDESSNSENALSGVVERNILLPPY